MSAEINLVVALPCEAKPLTAYFQLKKDHESPVFPIYRNSKTRINLIASGVGRVLSSASVAFLHAYLKLDHRSSYVNIGIAGSASKHQGQLMVADKISSFSEARAFYPAISLLKGFQFTALLTVDQPLTDYPLAGAVDMEGVGFFRAAQLFVDHERIHCLKIISDTSLEEMRAVTSSSAAELVQQQLPGVAEIVQQMQAMQNLLASPEVPYADFLSRWHFTVSQTILLQEALRRWQVLRPTLDAFHFCAASRHAGEVLKTLDMNLSV